MAAIYQIISNSSPAFNFEEPASVPVVSAWFDDDDQSTENGDGDGLRTETYGQAMARFSSLSDEARMVANQYGVVYEPAMLYITNLGKRLGSIPETLMAQLNTWLFASSDDCRFLLDVSVLISPDQLWGRAHRYEQWSQFSELALRLVSCPPSESDAGRTLSTQRNILGLHGTRFGLEACLKEPFPAWHPAEDWPMGARAASQITMTWMGTSKPSLGFWITCRLALMTKSL
jgi:hypothetical protein